MCVLPPGDAIRMTPYILTKLRFITIVLTVVLVGHVLGAYSFFLVCTALVVNVVVDLVGALIGNVKLRVVVSVLAIVGDVAFVDRALSIISSRRSIRPGYAVCMFPWILVIIRWVRVLIAMAIPVVHFWIWILTLSIHIVLIIII